MLVLSRKKGQALLIKVPGISDHIRISVAPEGSMSVKVAIQAPQSVRVLREELLPESGWVDQLEVNS